MATAAVCVWTRTYMHIRETIIIGLNLSESPNKPANCNCQVWVCVCPLGRAALQVRVRCAPLSTVYAFDKRKSLFASAKRNIPFWWLMRAHWLAQLSHVVRVLQMSREFKFTHLTLNLIRWNDCCCLNLYCYYFLSRALLYFGLISPLNRDALCNTTNHHRVMQTHHLQTWEKQKKEKKIILH